MAELVKLELSNLVVTEKQITTSDDRLEIILNSVLVNFGDMGVFMVDKDHPDCKNLIEKALQLASLFENKEEIERLKGELNGLVKEKLN